jgi:hypothetical protein
VHHGNGRGAEERPRVVPNSQGMDDGPIPPQQAANKGRRGMNDRVALTGEEILSLGLTLVGFSESRQAVQGDLNMRRFRSFFGIGPVALAAMFSDIANIDSITIHNFLMTINWMKLYDTEHVMAGRWALREETVRRRIKDYTQKIQQLKATKVQMGGFDDDEVFIISVDGVHCRIQEVRKDPGAKWYSHKFNAAGVGYELGIAVRTNRLVWINGPFPASRHDITTFRSAGDPENGLMAQIPDGKRAIGDSGYKGESAKISVTHAGESRDVKKFKGRVKARHETFNSRLKCFNVLDVPFRHGFEHHKQVFEAVCLCIQYDIENGTGLFEV